MTMLIIVDNSDHNNCSSNDNDVINKWRIVWPIQNDINNNKNSDDDDKIDDYCNNKYENNSNYNPFPQGI